MFCNTQIKKSFQRDQASEAWARLPLSLLLSRDFLCFLSLLIILLQSKKQKAENLAIIRFRQAVWLRAQSFDLCESFVFFFVCKILPTFFLSSFLCPQSGQMSANDIMRAMDKNLNAESRIITSKMVVRGRRNSRTIESKNWVVGTELAFTEYLSPPREAGTKMLKLGEKLYTYSPQTDRVIQISGHMLRQSVMGSDMSYNDMMEDRPIEELYKATIEGSVNLDGRDHWIIVLDAKVRGLSYPKRKSWVDKEYLLPIKEELYAKSGKLLKTASLHGIKKIQGRWFPSKFIYKDELKRNSKGTEWIIDNIEFNKKIPDSRFSKALLRK